jgi:outer membrane receptor protein involved in Fe transport
MNPLPMASFPISRVCRLLGLLLLAWPWTAALATSDLLDLPLDQLLRIEVSAASRLPLPKRHTPSATIVVTAQEIRALGHRSLADVLNTMRGVLISSDRTYAYAGVRGFSAPGDYNTRVLLLVDGNRINDTVYDQAFLGEEFPIDLDLVDRVEYIPGQGSAVHGSNALFAVVNVVTRSPGEPGNPSELSASTASAGTHRVRAGTRFRLENGAAVMISATARRRDGQDLYYPDFDQPPASDGISRGTDRERADQLFLKYRHSRVTATLVHSDRIKGLSGEPGMVFSDARNSYRDRHTLGNAEWEGAIGTDKRLRLRAYAGSYGFRGLYVIDYPPETLNRDLGESRWWGAESIVLMQPAPDHRTAVGLDWQTTTRADQFVDDLPPNAHNYLSDRRSDSRLSGFIENHWQFDPDWALIAGLRHDHHDETGGRFSHRLGLAGTPSPGWTTRLSHGTAFRRANAYEKHYALPPDGGYKANPALRAEQVRGTEASVEREFGSAHRLTVAAFTLRARHLITQRLDPADDQLVFENHASLRTHGLEVEHRYQPRDNAWLRLSYARYWAREQTQERPAGQSLQLAKATFVAPVRPGWTLGWQTLLTGPRGALAGHGVTHATLSTTSLGYGLRLSASVFDLFDRKPDDVGTGSILQTRVPQDGRTFQLRLDARF